MIRRQRRLEPARNRVVHAFRVAAPPTVTVLILSAFAFVVRWSKFADDPVLGLAIVGGLDLIVFLTYFVLGLTGFKGSPEGDVDAPRVYALPLVFAVVVLVFGVVFYFLLHRS